MAGTLTFKVSEVRRLVEHSKACKEHRPSYEDLFVPEYHKGGEVKKDENDWPDSKNIDHCKLPAGLWLVADQGVYLMSNGNPSLLVEEGKSTNIVAYAAESDPTAGSEFDDWYEAKHSIMGGDDSVTTLPITMFDPVLAVSPDDATLKIKVTSRQIQVLMPKIRNH